MDADEIADIFSSFGPVTCRRMFGGIGIYADGLMFALQAFDELYLKADDPLAARLEAEGAARFTYQGKGRTVALPYWTIPASRLDDPDEVADVAREALAVARRAAVAKAAKPARRPPALGKKRT